MSRRQRERCLPLKAQRRWILDYNALSHKTTNRPITLKFYCWKDFHAFKMQALSFRTFTIEQVISPNDWAGDLTWVYRFRHQKPNFAPKFRTKKKILGWEIQIGQNIKLTCTRIIGSPQNSISHTSSQHTAYPIDWNHTKHASCTWDDKNKGEKKGHTAM
jgi:hypothetical protein